MTALTRPGISEWRDAAFDDHRDAVEIISLWRNALPAAVLRRVFHIRDRNEPLLIRAGMTADGDRL